METYIDEEGHTVKVYADGTKRWLKNGECHRDGDKPAITWRNGTKEWWKNGRIHRENNPAIIDKDPQDANFYHLKNGRKVLAEKEYWVRLLLLEY